MGCQGDVDTDVRPSAGMRELDDLDVLGDEVLRARMLRWSLVVLLGTAVLVVPLLILARPDFGGLVVALGEALVACLVALPVHELIHAAAFRLLGGRVVRISFGCEAGCLYTRTNDAVLSRRRFVAVLLAPSVVLTAVLVALGVSIGSPVAGVLAAGLHLTGCTGDLLMAWIICRTPGVSHVQDTATGCRLLG